MTEIKKTFVFSLALAALSLGCHEADSPDSVVDPVTSDPSPTGEGKGDCENGMKNGETGFDGCNDVGCEDGVLWTTTKDCLCYLEDGQKLSINQTLDMDDGCTVCTCASPAGLECDASACDPGQAAGYCPNGMKEGETVWYGCWGRSCFQGGIVELDREWQCETHTGEVIRAGETETLEDGCTVCSCSCDDASELGASLSCDDSACEPDPSDCEGGLRNGESYFDGCNTVTCEEGRLETTTIACSCTLEDGTVLEHQQSVSLPDGQTVCTCVAQDTVECHVELE